MPVGIMIHNVLYNLGPADLIHAAFSTIAAHLEPGEWGERFTILLKELYAGTLNSRNVDAALAELRQIRTELREIGPEYAIWDIRNIMQHIPDGPQVWKKAPNLSEYFRSGMGISLLDELEQDLEILKRQGGTARLLNIK